MAWRWPWVKRATMDAAIHREAQAYQEGLIEWEAKYSEAKTELEARVQRQIDSNNQGVDILRARLVKDLAAKVRLITECEIALRYGTVTRYVPGEGGAWSPIATMATQSQTKTQREQGGWIAAFIYVTPHLLTAEKDPEWLADALTREIHNKIRLALMGAEAHERGARRDY